MSNVQIRRACAAGLGRRCARITSIRRRRGHWTASHSSAPTQLVPARESPRTMASDRVIHTRRAKVTLTRERRRRTERVPATIAPRRATTARPTEPLISFFGISFLSPPTSHRRNESDDRRRTWRRVLREIDADKNERIELTNPSRKPRRLFGEAGAGEGEGTGYGAASPGRRGQGLVGGGGSSTRAYPTIRS